MLHDILNNFKNEQLLVNSIRKADRGIFAVSKLLGWKWQYIISTAEFNNKLYNPSYSMIWKIYKIENTAEECANI